jgi:hydroxymethylglutaryl-CoA lyase
LKIIECPRDAMQGLEMFIPTEKKVDYINQLLKVGFDTIDFGSFVSPKAIPQMRDTADVLDKLDWKSSKSKLLAIVANTRGALDASKFEAITYIGFPLSISETFQQRNTNKSIADALDTLKEIKSVCTSTNKKLVVYISMGFGNPYGDAYDVNLVNNFVNILVALGADIISLSDTVGVATTQSISFLFQSITNQYTSIEIGAHLHSSPATAYQKIASAFEAGCRRFDGAIKGFGGCPMAADELVGNLPTESIISYLDNEGIKSNIDREAFQKALYMADEIFLKH